MKLDIKRNKTRNHLIMLAQKEVRRIQRCSRNGLSFELVPFKDSKIIIAKKLVVS
jgi:hypothetical protein